MMGRDELNALTPRLRRYARALVSGSAEPCEVADSLVHATLMRAIGSRAPGGAADLPARLFATVTHLHRDLAPATAPGRPGFARTPRAALAVARASAPQRDGGLATALLRMPVEEREALLLVVLERFDHASAARILRISRPALLERLTRARVALGRPGAVATPSQPVPVAAGGGHGGTAVPYLRLVVG